MHEKDPMDAMHIITSLVTFLGVTIVVPLVAYVMRLRADQVGTTIREVEKQALRTRATLDRHLLWHAERGHNIALHPEHGESDDGA